MNTKTLKSIGTAVSLLIGMGVASPALATSTGPQILGGAANSIDVWTFTCPAGFVGAAARVTEIPPMAFAQMQVVLSKNGIPTAMSTAPNAGQSPLASVIDGAGLYAVAFKKTCGPLVQGYRGDVYCAWPAGPFPLLLDPPGGIQKHIDQ